VFIFRWIEPPGNLHAGFLGLCVNIPVMFAVSRATPSLSPALRSTQNGRDPEVA
jgi:hypothetical protein